MEDTDRGSVRPPSDIQRRLGRHVLGPEPLAAGRGTVLCPGHARLHAAAGRQWGRHLRYQPQHANRLVPEQGRAHRTGRVRPGGRALGRLVPVPSRRDESGDDGPVPRSGGGGRRLAGRGYRGISPAGHCPVGLRAHERPARLSGEVGRQPHQLSALQGPGQPPSGNSSAAGQARRCPVGGAQLRAPVGAGVLPVHDPRTGHGL